MDIVLHLGAHRCGSTAVEQTVTQNLGVLGPERVEIWPPEVFRAIKGFAHLPRVLKRGETKRAKLTSIAEDLGGRYTRSEAAGARTLIWSEENLIGGMHTNLAERDFYASARSRLQAYASFLPAPPKRVALAIRGYAAYWRSAYLYVLDRRTLPEFDDLAVDLSQTNRGWRDLIADIRAVFAEAEILVWRQEALKGHELDIVARLTGRPTAEGLTLPRRTVNATRLTPADMPAMHRINRDMADTPRIERREALKADRDARTGPAPQMFTATQIAAMDQRYRIDWERLTEGFCGATLLSPLKEAVT